MARWIDYKKLKREIAFIDVLDHYNVQTKTKGGQAKGKCPLPAHDSGSSKQSFSVNLDRNIFQCFGCGAKGNVLDFIALMENLNPQNPKDFRKAAELANRKFLYTPQHEPSASAKRPAKNKESKPRVIVNPPLDFELQGLDAEHPWFEDHGIKPETVRYFGLGYCKRGLMKGRIAIPLHDSEGQLIGYAGQLVDESKAKADNPMCLLPSKRERKGIVYNFNPALFLYNGHIIAEPVNNLMLVERFVDVWHLWQELDATVVGLMGSSCSPEQAKMIVSGVHPSGRVWLITNGNDADERCALNLIGQLAEYRFTRWLKLDQGMKLTDLDRKRLIAFRLTNT